MNKKARSGHNYLDKRDTLIFYTPRPLIRPRFFFFLFFSGYSVQQLASESRPAAVEAQDRRESSAWRSLTRKEPYTRLSSCLRFG